MRRLIFFFTLIAISSKLFAQFSLERNDTLIRIIQPYTGKIYAEFPAYDFLSVSKRVTEVKASYGSYRFKNRETNKLSHSRLVSAQGKGSTLVLSGYVFDTHDSMNFVWTIQEIAKECLNWEITLLDKRFNSIRLFMNSLPGEHFFGGGEQYSNLDLSGKKFLLNCEEQGIGRGDMPITRFTKLFHVSGDEFTSYAPVPFFITNKGHATFFRNMEPLYVDFSDPTSQIYQITSSEMKGQWILGRNIPEMITRFTALNGRSQPLPEWAYGTVLGLQGGRAKIEAIVDSCLRIGMPVSAIWIQDWEGRRKTRLGSQLNWQWMADEKEYPDFKKFCKNMNDKGVKVLGYINPFLADTGVLTREAKAKHLLIKDSKGQDYRIKTAGFPAYMLDLENPAARIWIKQIIANNLIGQGLSGWMADFGEWRPYDDISSKTRDAFALHNAYPLEWMKVNDEAVNESSKSGDIVYFNSSGYGAMFPSARMFWTGDQLCGWGENDGLPSALTALLSGGLSGIGLDHSDVGGYTSNKRIFGKTLRTAELFDRWAEMAAFTPFFRTHEGLNPVENYQFYRSASGYMNFLRASKIHEALRSYLKFCVDECASNGLPVIRPLVLHYENDSNTYHIKNEFLCGPDLLVIPQFKPGSLELNAYFPAGEWLPVWENQTTVAGPTGKVLRYDPGKPAAYVRAGSHWEKKLITAFQAIGH